MAGSLDANFGAGGMSHPYRDLSDSHFWSRAVAGPAPHELDPVVEASFQVAPEDQVATLGSCFAQNLSRYLQRSGLGYLVTEPGPEEADAAERRRRSYGVFSARYGNVYTVRQAVQLFDLAYGQWSGCEEQWRRDDGSWVDPLRPTVEPDGFASLERLDADRQSHLAAVRRVFEDASVIVFTLGLTEGWRSRMDGALFPVVPGAAGGAFDPERHEFVNFHVGEVTADLLEFADRVHTVNPGARVLLTVSPVPLIATYSDRHVLTATTYSKSVLRVAAAQAERARDFVDYFPAYEIVTSAASGGHYFAPDLRSVTDDGVAHVMRVFRRHYIAGGEDPESASEAGALAAEFARVNDVMCDEELLDPAMAAANGEPGRA